MKLTTLLKLAMVFIADKEFYDEFIDELEKQGYAKQDIEELIDNLKQ